MSKAVSTRASNARTPATKQGGVRQAQTTNFRKPRAERWEELLEAAAEIFYEKGYDAASLQEIADRVGILKGSIYYYIKTKADLRDHLLLEVHHRGLAMIKQFAASQGTALDRLEAMIRGHVNFVCSNLPKTTVYLQELKKLDPIERTKMFGEHPYRDVFREVIEQGQREGLLLPELDAKMTAQAMLGTLNSPYQWYQNSRARQAQAVAEYFVKTVLRGHATEKGLRQLRA